MKLGSYRFARRDKCSRKFKSHASSSGCEDSALTFIGAASLYVEDTSSSLAACHMFDAKSTVSLRQLVIANELRY
jgi:hypothetical protein